MTTTETPRRESEPLDEWDWLLLGYGAAAFWFLLCLIAIPLIWPAVAR